LPHIQQNVRPFLATHFSKKCGSQWFPNLERFPSSCSPSVVPLTILHVRGAFAPSAKSTPSRLRPAIPELRQTPTRMQAIPEPILENDE
jgi:hypothetical protein